MKKKKDRKSYIPHDSINVRLWKKQNIGTKKQVTGGKVWQNVGGLNYKKVFQERFEGEGTLLYGILVVHTMIKTVKKIFYWSIVDLPCCISSRCTAK